MVLHFVQNKFTFFYKIFIPNAIIWVLVSRKFSFDMESLAQELTITLDEG